MADVPDDKWVTVSHNKRKYTADHLTERQCLVIQTRENIRNLANTLMSMESINLQVAGWQYAGIARGGANWQRTDTDEFITLLINNKWKDTVVFTKPIKIPQGVRD